MSDRQIIYRLGNVETICWADASIQPVVEGTRNIIFFNLVVTNS
jgi:hypothetical protein